MTEDTSTRSSGASERSGNFVQRLFSIKPSDFFRLALMSVLVGFLLVAFNIEPTELWGSFLRTVTLVWGRFLDYFAHGAADLINYLVLGAVIVVPIWIFGRIMKATQRD
jgi:hypothetical protein